MVKFMSQSGQKFASEAKKVKTGERKRSQREVRYELASKKQRMNGIKTPEPSISVDIN